MSKKRYTMVGKTGNEIYSADSFAGFIGMTFVTCLLSFITIALVGTIVCGISSIIS